MLPRKCLGSNQSKGCCTKETPCQYHDGNCDTDQDCEGDLVCGSDNCFRQKLYTSEEFNVGGWVDCCTYEEQKNSYSQLEISTPHQSMNDAR
jgi:hypothetical protein